MEKENPFTAFILFFILLLCAGIFISNPYTVVETINNNVSIVGTNNGALDVYIQDQTTEIVDLKLTRLLDNITLDRDLELGEYIINVTTTGHVPQIYNLVCLREDKAFYQGDILNVVSLGGNKYQVTLDSPIDYAYTTSGGCSIRDSNWAKDGSVTDLIYSISPINLINTSWDITRLILVCRGDGIGVSDEAPDMTSFMVTEPLTNGIVFRRVDGSIKNIFTVRDNFHLASEAYDLTLYDKNRLGEYGSVLRRTFNGQDKNGVVIRLSSESEDRFELIIRDDLTDMIECQAVVQGHVVE